MSLQVFDTYPLTPLHLWTPDLAIFFLKRHAKQKWHEWGVSIMFGKPSMIDIAPRIPKLHLKFQYDIEVACAAVEALDGINIDKLGWEKGWTKNRIVIDKALEVNAEDTFPQLSQKLRELESIQWKAVNSRRPYLSNFQNTEWVIIALGRGLPPTKLVKN